MCAEEPLFSLTPVCHFLSLHPSSLQSATSCPSLLPSEVPPAPSGTAQDFTLSLRNVQEVQQTTLSHIDTPGLGPECMLWKWLESSRNIWCVRFKLGYTQMGTWVVQFGSMNVQNGSFWELTSIGDRSENEAALSQSPLSFQAPTRPMLFNRKPSCVIVSTLCKTPHAQQEL